MPKNTEADYRAALAEHTKAAKLSVVARQLGIEASTLKWWKSELQRRDRGRFFLSVKVVNPPRPVARVLPWGSSTRPAP